MSIWSCETHGMTGPVACCGKAWRVEQVLGIRPDRSLILECFDRFVAEMRARLESEPCLLSCGDGVGEGMSLKIGKVRLQEDA